MRFEQMEATQPTSREAAAQDTGLSHTLARHLNRGELLALCHQLTVDYDALSGGDKEDKMSALVVYLEGHARTAELVETGKRLRPDLDWEGSYLTVEGSSLVPADGVAQLPLAVNGNHSGEPVNGAEVSFR